jgi:hypothetical protein
MRRSWTRKLAAPLFATSLVACSDGIGPGQGSVDYMDLALDFCNATGQFPVFFAYLNEGEGWTRVNGDLNRTFAFRASDKVGVAMVFTDGAGTYFTDVFYAKNEELEPLSGSACTEAIGTKTVSGSVANVADGDYAYVSMGLTTELVEPPPSTYSLFDLANAPLDLVAHSGSSQITGDVPDAFIIRRAQNPPDGSTLSTLDFNSAEAAAPAVNTVTISGLSASEDNLIDLYFSTATTFDQPIFLSSFFTSGTQTIYHVPSALTQAGDLHLLDVYGTTTSGVAVRGETQWYRNAGNRTVALGSHLSTPAISSLATSPIVRLRAQLPVQPEYNSFALALYEQIGTTTVRAVSVLGTAGYFNSPSTWVLDIPDLSGVSGFPTASGLASGGTSTNYQVFAYGGNLATFFGAPEEGSTMKYAARSSSTTTMMSLRADQVSGRKDRRAPGMTLGRRKLGVR